ncbi:hypothetical protein ACH4FE_25175 [Streptomyces celluloflavus]|uniref:hypothetical protein n=1 Tax=Streptomyces celluloflavus TaxID=58344 RepID=UPI00379B8850
MAEESRPWRVLLSMLCATGASACCAVMRRRHRRSNRLLRHRRKEMPAASAIAWMTICRP